MIINLCKLSLLLVCLNCNAAYLLPDTTKIDKRLARSGYQLPVEDSRLNPLDYTICNTGIDPDNLLRDSDYDGVIDIRDKEPNSDSFACVNDRGESIDSDGDGCLDHLDPQPCSSSELPIENCVNVIYGECATISTETAAYGSIQVGAISYLTIPYIFFDEFKADIRKDAIPELNQMADWLNRYPQTHITVKPALDESAGELDYDLCLNRGRNAINYLLEKGVDQNQICIGFSNHMLVENPVTEMEHQLNRRVELVLE